MRLIDADALRQRIESDFYWNRGSAISSLEAIDDAPTVNAYTVEQVGEIIRQAEVAKDENGTLRTGLEFLKNCINCKIRNTCPRHCGKVVHSCDHWEYGDPVVHGRWVPLEYDGYADGTPVWDLWECSECGKEHSGDEDSLPDYCSNCGAKMDKEVSDDAQM